MVKEEEIVTEAAGRGYMDMLALGEDDYFNFTGQEQFHGDGLFGFQHYGGDHAIPVAVSQKSSPTTECSSSISSMSSSPTATAISAISSSKPQAFKKKGSRGGDQRKAAPAAATNKRPRVRRERLGERIIALQQLVSPFGKSDTASVLHEALGYIRFLHDQVQVLSSPYMQRLPPSAHVRVQESAAGTVVEPPRPGDLRSRGLCLVPISCTEHIAGNGTVNGADIWSVAAGMAKVTAAAENMGAAEMLPDGHPGHLA
ncbi:transcription factor bHLH113-like isoform X1 [Phragmites australis]|uniref:transcription factor bHLH113-like isoform X1 n=1 Tax=Phragmites australis TaxID=29695 RepID=UPI002D769005|nr:transcription factor bHLH113-like isoform X1 [Phragmites australis]